MKKAIGAILASSLALAVALPAAAQQDRTRTQQQDMTDQGATDQGTHAKKKTHARKSSHPARETSSLRTDRKAVSAAERQLRANGHQVDRVDGRVDASTLNATANFQLERGLPPTGLLDLQTLAALGIDLEPTNQIGQVPQQ